MILLITGAITPAVNKNQTIINDVKERQNQYLSSIRACIDKAALINRQGSVAENKVLYHNILKIVYCDNSNPSRELFADLIAYADTKKVPFELVSFLGDVDSTRIHGKGYGEGEITAYAVNNSLLIKADDYFIKLTGRLGVDNLEQIVPRLMKDRCYFNIPNHTNHNICDTRFYGLPIKIYKKYFANVYRDVNDDKGYYYEHAFIDTIRKHKIECYNFPFYPMYSGKSGTSGGRYTYKNWKNNMKNVLSFFQYYRVK